VVARRLMEVVAMMVTAGQPRFDAAVRGDGEL
jgi:hypothetical protein